MPPVISNDPYPGVPPWLSYTDTFTESSTWIRRSRGSPRWSPWC